MRSIHEIPQYTRDAEDRWTWFCPICKDWGAFERLSFAYTASESHKKVVHHA